MMDAFGGWISEFIAAAGALFGLSAGSPDSWPGIVTSVLAGAAAAVAVAILMGLYLRRSYRSVRDMAVDGVALLSAFGLLAFAAYDVRHTAFDYLGFNASKPAVEFEIRLPTEIASAATAPDAQVELHTNRNQRLARVQRKLAAADDGRGVLTGSVPLDFRTTDRTVILNLPGQAPRLFKLRLAANPSRSPAFGPWHLADRVVSPRPDLPRSTPDDAYAIRYRVM